MVCLPTPLSVVSASDSCRVSDPVVPARRPNWHYPTQSYRDPDAVQVAPATSRDSIQLLAGDSLSPGTSHELVRCFNYFYPRYNLSTLAPLSMLHESQTQPGSPFHQLRRATMLTENFSLTAPCGSS
jgi:hypothetical protein